MGSMEAQVADGGSKRNSILGYCRYLGSRISYSMKDHKKRDSWLDVVDGVVTKLAGKVAKWTADDGGNEGLLLPLSKGRVD
jgi:hypothetical protein